MARGRMLNNEISDSVKFQQLPDDTCRLLATWTIAHLDKNGVFHAEPALVRSKIFPWRDDITIPQVAGYLDAMEGVGLIERFSQDGHVWQVWRGFAEHQPGLRAERESTRFPCPPDCPPIAGNLPEVSGNLPEDCGQMPEDCGLNININIKQSQQEVNINNNTGADAPDDADVVADVAVGAGWVLAMLLGVPEMQVDKAEEVANSPPERVRGWIDYAMSHESIRNKAGFVVAMCKKGVDPPARAAPGDDGDWQRFEASAYADYFER